jgi:hypothetical protein
MMKDDLRSGRHSLFVDVPFAVRGREIILGGDVVGKMAIETANSPRRLAVRVGESRASGRLSNHPT